MAAVLAYFLVEATLRRTSGVCGASLCVLWFLRPVWCACSELFCHVATDTGECRLLLRADSRFHGGVSDRWSVGTVPDDVIAVFGQARILHGHVTGRPHVRIG